MSTRMSVDVTTSATAHQAPCIAACYLRIVVSIGYQYVALVTEL